MDAKIEAEKLVKMFEALTEHCNCSDYSCTCFTMYRRKAKQCALKTVNELSKHVEFTEYLHDTHYMKFRDYYKKLKQEIKKIGE